MLMFVMHGGPLSLLMAHRRLKNARPHPHTTSSHTLSNVSVHARHCLKLFLHYHHPSLVPTTGSKSRMVKCANLLVPDNKLV
jgi:hypothetical protein